MPPDYKEVVAKGAAIIARLNARLIVIEIITYLISIKT